MTKRKIRASLTIAVGVLFLFAATGFQLYNNWQDDQAGKAAQSLLATANQEIRNAAKNAAPSGSGTAESKPGAIGGNTLDTTGKLMGILSIPAIDRTLPILSDYSLDSMSSAPCRYTGDGILKKLVICGHNYPRFFGKLKYLKKGDAVTLTDMTGRVYRFMVSDVLVVAANDWNTLESGTWDMTLFTCTVGGQKRVLVRCTLDK